MKSETSSKDIPSPEEHSQAQTSDEPSTFQEQSQQFIFDGLPMPAISKRTTDRQGRMRNPSRSQKRSNIEKKCKCCGTTNTPVWRWGGDAKETLLCNACSLRIRRSNARPQRSKDSDPIMKRPSQAQYSSDDVDEQQQASPTHMRQLSPDEIDALRSRLAGFMFQEKTRLLGAMSEPELFQQQQWYGPEFPPMHVRHRPPMMMGQMAPSWQPYGRRAPMWPADVVEYGFGPDPHPLHDQEMAHMYS